MNQWEFYVVPTKRLSVSAKSIGLVSLKRLSEVISFDQLRNVIKITFRQGQPQGY